MIARQSATRCFMPPESCCGRLLESREADQFEDSGACFARLVVAPPDLHREQDIV